MTDPVSTGQTPATTPAATLSIATPTGRVDVELDTVKTYYDDHERLWTAEYLDVTGQPARLYAGESETYEGAVVALLAHRMGLQAEVRPPVTSGTPQRRIHRAFEVGDVVNARYPLNASWIDEGLEQEGEDARIRVRVAAGTRGQITAVRDYATPYPYLVEFEGAAHEIGVEEHTLERAAT